MHADRDRRRDVYHTANRRVLALHADSGKVIWDFDPLSAGPNVGPLASAGSIAGVPIGRTVSQTVLGGFCTERRMAGCFRLMSAPASLTGIWIGRRGQSTRRSGSTDRKLPYGPTSARALWVISWVLGFSNGEGPDIAARVMCERLTCELASLLGPFILCLGG